MCRGRTPTFRGSRMPAFLERYRTSAAFPEGWPYANKWRCPDCRCLNADTESTCYRCGAGQPERHTITTDDLIERALIWFQDEYRKHFPQGGDGQDHGEAQSAAMEAVVVALTEMRPCPYCDPQTPGFQRVDAAGHLERCGCDRGFFEPLRAEEQGR